jgi:hypothetical protein
MNTALIVEPRDLEKLPLIINHFHITLGDTWKVVFYCGKGLSNKWKNLLYKAIEVRELDVENYTTTQYSDLLKTSEIWESLYGEYVLIFQADAWIINKAPYTIDYFTQMNKSYIGGNMCYKWIELQKDISSWNFNGGLSLRKRNDMITIIKTFPPIKTQDNPPDNFLENGGTLPPIEVLAEDVYFVSGCYRLNLPVGDTYECEFFAIHTIYKNEFFGVHKPSWYVRQYLVNSHPECMCAYI